MHCLVKIYRSHSIMSTFIRVVYKRFLNRKYGWKMSILCTLEHLDNFGLPPIGVLIVIYVQIWSTLDCAHSLWLLNKSNRQTFWIGRQSIDSKVWSRWRVRKFRSHPSLPCQRPRPASQRKRSLSIGCIWSTADTSNCRLARWWVEAWDTNSGRLCRTCHKWATLSSRSSCDTPRKRNNCSSASERSAQVRRAGWIRVWVRVDSRGGNFPRTTCNTESLPHCQMHRTDSTFLRREGERLRSWPWPDSSTSTCPHCHSFSIQMSAIPTSV